MKRIIIAILMTALLLTAFAISALVYATGEESEQIGEEWDEEKTIVYGDATGDGKVKSNDVTLIKKYLANYNYTTKTSTVEVSDGADCNGDGNIKSSDVTLLKKYLANYNYTTGTSTIELGPKK